VEKDLHHILKMFLCERVSVIINKRLHPRCKVHSLYETIWKICHCQCGLWYTSAIVSGNYYRLYGHNWRK